MITSLTDICQSQREKQKIDIDSKNRGLVSILPFFSLTCHEKSEIATS